MEFSLGREIKPTASQIIKKHGQWLLPFTILFIIAAWEGIIHWGKLPPFILPPPEMVLQRLGQSILDGSLLRNTADTLLEVVLGLFLGSTTASVLGYLLAKSRALERTLSPYLVASQAIPIVAVAPLLVIWFGSGMISKVLICALIVFFPVLVNTVMGLKAVPENLNDLMRSLDASPSQMLRYLEIPAALPVFLGGLRIGATLSVIGAVVGEFVGADRGLGFLISVARGQYDTAMVFVAIFTLIAMALGLYGVVVLIERKLLSWQHDNRK